MRTEPILVSWVGSRDLKIMHTSLTEDNCSEKTGYNGPLRTFTDGRAAGQIYILFSKEFEKETENVKKWVARGTCAALEIVKTGLKDPTDYNEIYEVLETFFKAVWEERYSTLYQFNLTPGTPAITAIMLYMSQVRYSGGTAFKVVEPEHAKDGKQIFPVYLPFWVPTSLLGKTDYTDDLGQEQNNTLRKYAPIKAVNILLLGETGVGKSSFARLIHDKTNSSTENSPFVVANCAELAAGDGNMFRSALFGAKKGAYSGAIADTKGLLDEAQGGTIFFDEIGEIPRDKQSILLRALQERCYQPLGSTKVIKMNSIRVIAATNHDLFSEIKADKFRSDLYYRLAMCTITIPPLREIIRHDLKRFKWNVTKIFSDIRKNYPELNLNYSCSDEAFTLMKDYAWPGNYRELQHVLFLACIEATSRNTGVCEYLDIKRNLHGFETLNVHSENENSAEKPSADDPQTWPENVFAYLEKEKERYVKTALAKTGNSIAQAAKLLGTSYQNVNYFIKKTNLRH